MPHVSILADRASGVAVGSTLAVLRTGDGLVDTGSRVSILLTDLVLGAGLVKRPVATGINVVDGVALTYFVASESAGWVNSG